MHHGTTAHDSLARSLEKKKLIDAGIAHCRTFHTPTGIGPTKAVWVVIDGQNPPAEMRCNETRLGTADGYAAFEITHLLRASNQLEILLPATQDPDPQRGSVHLEIRAAEETNS